MVVIVLLLVGAALGLMILRTSLRRIPAWSNMSKIIAPLGFSLFGLTPLGLLRLGVLDATGSVAVVSAGYFLVFTIVSTVLLAGRASRAEASDLRLGK